MNSSDNKIHEIHEFSTGIQFEQRGNSWVSTGFTGRYMNSTIGEIPKVVERSIANEEFALAEGSSTEKPAIIARILGSGDDIWSVIAVVTRGRDEVGRSAAFHRYFLCQGDHKLRVILAWWEQNNRPTFNPLDKQDEGSPHIFEGEIPQPPDLEQILPLFKVQTKPQEEQRLSSSSQSAQEAVLTWGVPGQSGETRVIKEGIFPLSEEPVSTPESQNVEEYSLFQQLSPIVLEPNVQYDLYTINVLAINKWNSCKNGLPVCWAFDVEALLKPERFQVIKPASQKARDGINRAIAAGSRVVRNAVNIDEAALKSALRSLANSSQVKPESVETIINGLNNKDVTREYWHSLFNAQGTDRAIKEKIYSPQIVRLMTLRALVIPETLPEFLQWLNIQKGSNVDGNQRVSLELQKKIQPLFPKEQIGAGITYLLPSLLGGKISVDGLCWLLAKSGGDTIWAYGRNQFINNIKYDLQLIYNYYSKPIVVGLFDESTLKCKAEVWRSLINRWRDIRGEYKKCEKYRPLAQLFERFKEYDLAGYFYQVSDGVVKKDLFYEIPKAQNRPSPVIYGLGIEREVTLEDIIIGLADGVVKFFNQDVDMKLVFVIPVSLLILGSGWFIGSKTWQYVYANEAEKFLCQKSGGGENCPVIVLDGKTHYSFDEIKQVIPKVVKQFIKQPKKISTPEPTQSGSNTSGQSSEQQYTEENVIKKLIQILGDKNLKYQDLKSTDKIEEAVKTQWVIAVYNYQLKSKIDQKVTTQKSGKEECVSQIFFCLKKNIKTEEIYSLETYLTKNINKKINPPKKNTTWSKLTS
ncbi:hypothetical protein [Cylindrospermopsis raciborskii]|uniref:hypothetical protein n=1 Tax=Cylindrospermopsis raciborskii TaxID=77022 RepID=UPI0001C15ABB|nr:hypothetical protein [Cylindrospermopsis raciborskii]EFA68378.1 hypothetical protein CRC_03200 [Cylindrospermopsis raciborskii CS-505]